MPPKQQPPVWGVPMVKLDRAKGAAMEKGEKQSSKDASSAGRVRWLDGVRGIAIIWIVFFHCLLSYNVGSFPSPINLDSFLSLVAQCDAGSFFGKLLCAVDAVIVAIMQRGAQAVGVFILFSGFGLTYSLFKKRGRLEIAWAGWYKRRLARLFPIFWLAHLVFLVSPFTILHDRIDYRFFLSLLGDRVYPVDKMFFYLVPAWWFLGLLIEFYIAFPFLFKLMQRLGWARYLGLCIVSSAGARVILRILDANGDYEMGAFFVCRLWEFGAGMVLGELMAQSPGRTFRLLLSWKGFLGGVITYTLGLVTYQPNLMSVFSDGLIATGLSVILIHLGYRLDKVPGIGRAFALAGVFSYGIYLFHQPYVMFIAEKLRPFSFGVFLSSASAAIVLIALASMGLEHMVNRIAGRLFR